jgi:putative hemolysin
MDASDLNISLLILVALMAAGGFLAAVEFAILTLRRRRFEQLNDHAQPRAGAAFSAAERFEEASLAAQLGGVLCALLLGYLVVDLAVTRLVGLPPPAAAAIGLAIASCLYLIFLGAQHSGWVLHPLVMVPLRVVALLLRPLLAVLSFVLEVASERLRLSRSAFYAPIHTLDDIRDLVIQGHEQGVVEEDEREMIHGVFEFSETIAREVMTPRIDIVAVPRDVGLEELVRLVVLEGHSRIPVFEGSIDNVVGIVLAKDLIPYLAEGSPHRHGGFAVGALLREPYFVPETKPVDDILAEFRRSSVHLAIVIDEFGGTSGLVTMEDLLEEIVGEISDEHDVEEPEFAVTPEGDFLIDGGALIADVNDRFGLDLPESDFDTIGGYVFGSVGRVPVPGDRVDGLGEGGLGYLEVVAAEERRVTRVRLRLSGVAVAPESDDHLASSRKTFL